MRRSEQQGEEAGVLAFMRPVLTFLALALLAVTMVPASDRTADQAAGPSHPLVIAHRGASGLLPEHSLPAYLLGMEQGADYIEPDLVMTRDGHLVVRHDIYLSTTTNVADLPRFRDRKRTFEGREDWFVFDFTLKELRGLRVRQPRPERGQGHDGRYPVMTLWEVIAAVAAYDRPVGVYPEIKRPDLFISLGLDPTEPLLAALDVVESLGLPVYVQSFNGPYLRRLAEAGVKPLVLNVYRREDGTISTPIAPYADVVDAIGADKRLLFDDDGTSDFLARAHDLGLDVHAWTIRDDDVPARFDSVQAELSALFAMGVDGVFADFPATVRTVPGRISGERAP
ncbi:glycerophosphodiester phosphodiesterase family protein [Yunchengibacter salinarum]|uniref:glycerophosphodiester phosphodiesterase family protein n=1 Tax=Yunchengibacter salinarum TaxID=3133399 RepID=UPI0035B61E44